MILDSGLLFWATLYDRRKTTHRQLARISWNQLHHAVEAASERVEGAGRMKGVQGEMSSRKLSHQ